MTPRYPEISIDLVGHDGNAFAILSSCWRAASEAGLPKGEISEFYSEATSGDYNQLLWTVMNWFEVA